MADEGLAWFENVLGAASKNEQGDISDARCPKCNAADFVKIADLYAESVGQLEEQPDGSTPIGIGDLTVGAYREEVRSSTAEISGRGRYRRRNPARGDCVLCLPKIRGHRGAELRRCRVRRDGHRPDDARAQVQRPTLPGAPAVESLIHVPAVWSGDPVVSVRLSSRRRRLE